MRYDYISKILCKEKDNPNNKCNGICYLSKKNEKQEKGDAENNGIVKIDFYKIPHVLCENNKLEYNPKLSNKGIFVKDTSYLEYYSKPLIPPPKVIT